MKKVTFSIDLFDRDGDIIDKCILIHCDENIILKFNDIADLSNFTESLYKIVREIEEN